MDTVQELLEQACNDHGDVSFRNTYSGRGMYGRQCVGITGSQHECRRVIAAVIGEIVESKAGDHDLQEVIEELMLWDQDSMACDVIYYWPSLPSIDSAEELSDLEM